MTTLQLILASASPRRRELLALLGYPFEVIVSGADEDAHLDAPPLYRLTAVGRAKHQQDAIVAHVLLATLEEAAEVFEMLDDVSGHDGVELSAQMKPLCVAVHDVVAHPVEVVDALPVVVEADDVRRCRPVAGLGESCDKRPCAAFLTCNKGTGTCALPVPTCHD